MDELTSGAVGEIGEKGHVCINLTEIGHWETHEFNKTGDNTETTLNDVYTDGAIVGLVGVNRPVVTDQENGNFQDFYLKMYFCYRSEIVKESALWMQKLPEWNQLHKNPYQQKKHTIFTDEWMDMTGMTKHQMLAKSTSVWRLDLYSDDSNAKFYPVDMLEGQCGRVRQ